MRPVASLAVCALLTGLLTACAVGSGEVITEARTVEGFDEIDLRGMGEVRITVDGTETLTIEAEDNLIDDLTSDVRGSTLVLGMDRPIRPTEDIVFTVTMKALNGVEISGSGSVIVSEFSTEDFTVEVSGSGAADISAIAARDIFARISGSGTITMVGDTGGLDLSISGSGAFNGEALEADTGDVDISGSGSATVNVSETLEVDVSGSGNVDYIGDPSVSVNTSGSGNVTRR
jgi:hypothetical protein